MDLRQQVVLITGANGGLGTFVTKSFLDAGASVVGVSPSIAASAFRNENFLGLTAEISNGDQARALVSETVAKRSRIDALVHLVGAFDGGQSIAETGDATLERMLDLNFRSAFYMIRAVLPLMRKQGSGRILAIGSRAAVEPSPMAGAYAASKAALVSQYQATTQQDIDNGVVNILVGFAPLKPAEFVVLKLSQKVNQPAS